MLLSLGGLVYAKGSEPGVVEGLIAIESLFLVDDKQFAYKVLALLRNGFKLNVVEMEFRLLNFTEHFWRTASLERKVAADEGVEDYTKRPNVSLRTVIAFEHFWRHVVGSSHHFS